MTSWADKFAYPLREELPTAPYGLHRNTIATTPTAILVRIAITATIELENILVANLS